MYTIQKMYDAFQYIALAACVGTNKARYVIHGLPVNLGKRPQFLAVPYAEIYGKFLANRAVIGYFKVQKHDLTPYLTILR